VLSLVAETAMSLKAEQDVRGDALEQCMKKLPVRDRELLEARYEEGGSVETAAERNGRSLEAAYKALARIRRVLLECVNRETMEVSA
jgi:RNA polymerase sigma-70 factor (ECF subfamily)